MAVPGFSAVMPLHYVCGQQKIICHPWRQEMGAHWRWIKEQFARKMIYIGLYF